MDQAIKFEGNIGGLRPSLVPQEIITDTLNSLDTENKVANPFTRMAQGVIGAVRTIRGESGKQTVTRTELITYLDDHPDKMEDYFDTTYKDYWAVGGRPPNFHLVNDLFSISTKLLSDLYNSIPAFEPSNSDLRRSLSDAQVNAAIVREDEVGEEMEVAALLLSHTLPYKGEAPAPAFLNQFFKLDPRHVTRELVENTIRALESSNVAGKRTYDQHRASDRKDSE